jgi:hypothetical protein
MTLRALFSVCAVSLFTVGCNESSFFVKGDPELEGPKPGSIEGRVCDPSGRTWLADAKVYTHLFDPTGHLYETRLVYTDRDGRWILEELPPEYTYQIFVQYGDDIIETHEAYVGDRDAVSIEEPDCFDPLTLNVAVVTGDYDDFDLVLERMGFANYTLVDGLSESETVDFFNDLEGMLKYDVIFVNGGFVEEGVVFSDDGTHELYMQNIRDYVTAGGAIYASDWAYDLVEIGWPERLDFAGDDTIIDDAQVGEYDLVTSNIVDASLSDWLESSTLDIEYDLPVWPPIESVDEAAVTTHLEGNVSYRIGTETFTLVDAPLLVSFTSGEGKVVFSTFRVAKNGTMEMMEILQYMMYYL